MLQKSLLMDHLCLGFTGLQYNDDSRNAKKEKAMIVFFSVIP